MKSFQSYFRIFLKFFGAIILWEMILRWATFGVAFGFSKQNPFLLWELAIIAFFSMAIAALPALLRWGFRGSLSRWIFYILSFAMPVIFGSQIVYYHIFGTFYTFYSMLNGAQVAEFQDIIWSSIGAEILPLALCFAVGGGLLYGLKREGDHGADRRIGARRGGPKAAPYGLRIEYAGRRPRRSRGRMASAVSGILICALLFLGGTFGGRALAAETENRQPLALNCPADYLYRFNEIEGSVESFGMLSAMGLDMLRLVFGFTPQTDGSGRSLLGSDEEVLEAMTQYFNSRESEGSSGVNEKTGIFRGKNLIFITAESFADYAIDEELTPTLYKLQQEGFQFTNFYNPIWGVSTLDGEYVNCLSLIPKAGVWSMRESSDNALPYALGNQFSALGYETKAYHDHSIYFYHRDQSHTNLGYDFDGQGGGFSFTETWPESDLEMMEQTVPDFLSSREMDEDGNLQTFQVYYLTVSGHMDYDFDHQEMAAKHREEVADLDLSASCQAYLAANIELDQALENLLEQLDAAGELENTVIALAGDHYPYALTASEISEFRGHQVDEEYELYRSTMLLWTPGMEPETVDKVCSNLDILPTLSNLFGLDYDSSLLMGQDIFSDGEGLVVFENRDWITDRGSRAELAASAAAASETTSDVAASAAAADWLNYIRTTDEKVANMFIYSALILDKDYYRILGQG